MPEGAFASNYSFGGGFMKSLIIILLLISSSTWAASGNMIGIGYIAKADKTKAFASSTGDEVDDTAGKNFPFLAYNVRGVLSGPMASENSVDGRLHVRYWKNGVSSSDGENTAWLDPKDVARFSFDCCGDERCSGIKPQIFQSTLYSVCFNVALEEAKNKQDATAKSAETADLEKIKLQLEIEKLKMEMQKLKEPAQRGNQ